MRGAGVRTPERGAGRRVRFNWHQSGLPFLIRPGGAGASSTCLSDKCDLPPPAGWAYLLNVRSTLTPGGVPWLAQALALLSGIEPHKVVQVLSAERRLPVPAIAAGIRVLTISGRTKEGPPLIVAIRTVASFDHLIVGAREMTAEELARFEEWETGQ